MTFIEIRAVDTPCFSYGEEPPYPPFSLSF